MNATLQAAWIMCIADDQSDYHAILRRGLCGRYCPQYELRFLEIEHAGNALKFGTTYQPCSHCVEVARSRGLMA